MGKKKRNQKTGETDSNLLTTETSAADPESELNEQEKPLESESSPSSSNPDHPSHARLEEAKTDPSDKTGSETSKEAENRPPEVLKSEPAGHEEAKEPARVHSEEKKTEPVHSDLPNEAERAEPEEKKTTPTHSEPPKEPEKVEPEEHKATPTHSEPPKEPEYVHPEEIKPEPEGSDPSSLPFEPSPTPSGHQSFSIHYSTNFGEKIVIVGSTAELGSWDLSKSVPLEWTEGNIWKVSLPVTGYPIEYKYVCVTSDAPRWEEGPNHVLSSQIDNQQDNWQA